MRMFFYKAFSPITQIIVLIGWVSKQIFIIYYDASGFLKTISNLSVDIYNYLIIAVSDQKLESFELGIDDN